jgi:parallel beta-helix repeat protein
MVPSVFLRRALARPKARTSTHHVRNFASVSLGLLALAAFGGQAFATSNTAVGLCAAPGTHYLTIQAAVTAVEALAAPRVVRVCPGPYSEQVSITSALTLEGIAQGTSDAAVLSPPNGGLMQNGVDILGNPVAAQIFVANAGTVTVEHLTVDGTGNDLSGCGAPTLDGIYFQNTSGTIAYNAVRNQFQTDFADYGGCQNGLAINVESTSSANSVAITYNSVHTYQKNGITATGATTGPGSPGPAVTIKYNYIVGMGATAMNWMASAPAAENGIQVGFGASGSITANTVNDHIWEDDTASQADNAAAGILVYASPGVNVIENNVGSAQFGIVASDDTYFFCNGSSCGTSNGTTINGNKVAGTQIFDAIDLCSNSNNVTGNTLYGSTESGIHIDDSCTPDNGNSGYNNTVTGNSINEACAGILLGTGSGNTYSPNTYIDVVNTTLAGDVCPAGPDANPAGSKTKRLRPSPYRPGRK